MESAFPWLPGCFVREVRAEFKLFSDSVNTLENIFCSVMVVQLSWSLKTMGVASVWMGTEVPHGWSGLCCCRITRVLDLFPRRKVKIGKTRRIILKVFILNTLVTKWDVFALRSGSGVACAVTCVWTLPQQKRKMHFGKCPVWVRPCLLMISFSLIFYVELLCEKRTDFPVVLPGEWCLASQHPV